MTMPKYLIPTALLISLGGNAYSIVGGAGQYAVAAETVDQDVVTSESGYCTTGQRTLAASFINTELLPDINTKYSLTTTVPDLRPLQQLRWCYTVNVPLNSSGVPIAGTPGNTDCLLTKEIRMRMQRVPSPPGE